jgi:hypothetical protein
MNHKKVELFKKILEVVGDLPTYVYGKSLLLLFLNKEPTSINIFIKNKHVSDELIFKLKSLDETINVSFGKEIIFDSEIFTINCISCELKNALNQSAYIEGKHLTLCDLEKKIIRFIDKEQSSKNPKHIMEAILFSGEIDFNLEIDTMRHILTNKSIVKNLVKRDIFHIMKSIYQRSDKPRKTISLMNALGISIELFEIPLIESAVLNNLGKKDINGFFSLVFNNIDEEQQEKFLVEKVGFHLRDVEKVLQITKLLNVISTCEHTPTNIRKLLKNSEKDRVLEIYRLFKAIGMKDLANIVKQERNSILTYKGLCVNVDYIMKVFNVDANQANNLLDLALDLVIINQDLNDPLKLMNALNKQKKNI